MNEPMTTQPPRSYTRLAIAIIVAGVVIGAGIFASSYLRETTTVTRTTSETATIIPSCSYHTQTPCSNAYAPCDTPYLPSIIQGKNSSSSVLVFVTNSTAEVCVSYSNHSQQSVNVSVFMPVIYVLVNGEWGLPNCLTTSCTPTNLTTTLEAPSIVVGPNSSAVYAYQIVPEAGAHGLYLLGLPDMCRGPAVFILAVGYNVAELQAAPLNLPTFPTFNCGGSLTIPSVVGLSNLVPTYTG